MDDKNWQLREGDPFESPQALSDEQWLRDAGLVYALRGGVNYYEISVSMAAGSRETADREALAEHIRALLSHTAPQAEPKLTPCRHCGFRVALNESPVPESSPVSMSDEAVITVFAEHGIGIYNGQNQESGKWNVAPYKAGSPNANRLIAAYRSLLSRPAQDASPVQDGETAKRLSDLNFRKRQLETEVSDLRNTLTALRAQISTARAEGYAEAIEAAAKVNDESGLQPAISKRIRALRCPEQTAEAPNLIDFHNGEAAIWIEDGQVKAEWNEPFVSAAQSDSKDALQKIAAMLEGYAASYETMARDKAASGMVACSCVAVDIRQNMLSFVNNLAALPQQSTDGGQPNA